jgi:hopanoid C-3 methylase
VKVLFVHPGCLMHSEIFLRLEPLGLELVAASARRVGHAVRLLDLQVVRRGEYFRQLDRWRPDAVGFSLNYLANVPEVLDLARRTRRLLPGCFLFAGGHSASFVAPQLLAHAPGALDCVVRGEGEAVTPRLLEAARDGLEGLCRLPGVVTAEGEGPPPPLVGTIGGVSPARDLADRRRRYFIGALDPCASIEFSRGCPWDCAFCSAWTFFGRSYRKTPVEAAVEELARIREPNVFLVDDVAFADPDHADRLADAVARRGIRKQYYLETRSDLVLRHPEVFERWCRLGLSYMFLGLEAIDDERLQAFRKRLSAEESFRALEIARGLGITVAVNLISDPAWDERQFARVRRWAESVPEIVHLTVRTPCPGTETWLAEAGRLTTRDYRLFDVQHAVLPTALPLPRFYEELVRTQQVLNRKHLGLSALRKTLLLSARLLARGQTNFLRMLWKFPAVYNPARQRADHRRPVRYALGVPGEGTGPADRQSLFVHPPVAERHVHAFGEHGTGAGVGRRRRVSSTV